jgi:hypothetical protein
MRSSNVAKPAVCQATHTLTSSLALPIQLNLVPSNWAPGWPSRGSSAVPRPMVPKAVPSLGAALESQLARRMLAAPSMFFGITDGLPARCLPKWRASRRV